MKISTDWQRRQELQQESAWSGTLKLDQSLNHRTNGNAQFVIRGWTEQECHRSPSAEGWPTTLSQ